MCKAIAHDLTCKVGQDGLDALRVEGFRTLKGVEQELERDPKRDTLLLFHGERSDARKLLDGYRKLQILYIGNAPVLNQGLDSREHGFEFGIPTDRRNYVQRWDQLGEQIRNQLLQYVYEYRRGRKPDPNLLLSPRVPEHVIACYFAALAGKAEEIISDYWQEPFQREAEGLRRELGIEGLEWNDRMDAEKLRKFLRDAHAVVDSEA